MNKKTSSLLQGLFGIEKETLRVDQKGEIVSSKHPFANKFTNLHLKVDFGEQQLEMITSAHPSIDQAIDEIKLLTNIVYRHLPANEYLWNYSMPLGNISRKKIARKNKKEYQYRLHLAKTTSVEMQLISGIHFNWSLNEKLTSKMNDYEINNFYFNIFTKYQQCSFLIKNLFGMSPTADFKTFDQISYRQSEKGYQNKVFNKNKIFADYQSYCDYINNLIKTKKIMKWTETYSDIRLKPLNAKRIEWIEIRNIDLDYRYNHGINKIALNFIHKFLIFLSQNEVKFEIDWLLKSFLKWLKKEQIPHQEIAKIINDYYQKIKYEKPAIKIIIAKQKKLRQSYHPIILKQLKTLELSTQLVIEKAYLAGMSVKIIDRQQNKVLINDFLIEKATLNPFDSRRGLAIIDSKVKTNDFLTKQKYLTTKQLRFLKIESAIAQYQKLANKKIVIKPVHTNFSQGITIFLKVFSYEAFVGAIKHAFSFDKQIIIENFVAGIEYRFLVINNKFVGALERTPANVTGDGKANIAELIAQKNKHYLRGENYKLPLEKIKIDQIVKNTLAEQKLTLTSVIKAKQKIFLRHNSNISTGGDTKSVTFELHPKYKKMAIAISKKLGLKVCGFDVIIPDLTKFKNYSILELNWNPAIHIHTYPLVGPHQDPACYMINLIKENSK